VNIRQSGSPFPCVNTDWNSAVNGENIHTNTIQLSPQKAVDAWMANASESTISLNAQADD
jgi:hypothetical protein